MITNVDKAMNENVAEPNDWSEEGNERDGVESKREREREKSV